MDHIILATGYKPDMTKVPYLSGLVDGLELADGFPATRDFGPFFGFVRGCPAAATLTVAGLKEALDHTGSPA